MTFWHDGPLFVYYCHGLSRSASGLLLSCFIMFRFKSDTMDPRAAAMEGDVHLPEDETKCKREFTQMSISVAGYPSMECYT